MRWLARIDLRAFRVAAVAGCALFLVARTALALPAASGGASTFPCAMLENFGGDLQVLDASRTHLITLERGGAVPCNGWISTKQGWAKIKHQDGFQLSIASHSFVQVMDSRREGSVGPTREHLVVYRGNVHGQAAGGQGELQILTANARARVSRGAAIVAFAPEEEESQLITLENVASLENRFSRGGAVKVKMGESSTLNFKMLRVVPSTPRVITIASLKAKLAELNIDETEQSHAIRVAKNRQERAFASKFVEDDAKADDEQGGKHGVKRASKSKAAHKRDIASQNSDYARNKPSKDDARLKEHWVKKMVAGENVGEQILYPGQFYGRPQKVTLDVEDPAAKLNERQKKKDDAEKRRLIDELSKIRLE